MIPDGIDEAVKAAKEADVAVLFLGISGSIEWEEYDRSKGYPCQGGEVSPTLGLPGCQLSLLQAVHQTGTPTVLVLINGGPVSIPWSKAHIPAILEAFYPGNLGGYAVTDALFGDYNPGGKLPFTLYTNEEALPPLTDYRMSRKPGRTYRYYQGKEVLFPFGFGLSYTKFHFTDLKISPSNISPCDSVKVSVSVTNVGNVVGDEGEAVTCSHFSCSNLRESSNSVVCHSYCFFAGIPTNHNRSRRDSHSSLHD